jgi:DNA methylase
VTILATDAIRFVKELYPRLDPDDTAIERYRAAIDRLPPIVVARDGVLVDGYHRWQAHRREGTAEIEVEHLGDLTEIEILKESIRRNSSHGLQLKTNDKRHNADRLYRQGIHDYEELGDILSITADKARQYAADARRDEVEQQKQTAWNLWLDCWGPGGSPGRDSWVKLAEEVGVSDPTTAKWISKFCTDVQNLEPPESRQHFDIWQFGSDGGDSGYFGRMPPQVVENLLWLWTEPGQTVVDPFAGSGTTIRVAKAMGRRVWASDRRGAFWDETLPIHTHDITEGWPAEAPARADLVLLDPPYWQQAAGRYSDDPEDLGNMPLEKFLDAWGALVQACTDHLADGGRLAYIVSPSEADGRVVDLATDMLQGGWNAGLQVERRVIVPYSTQQASGAEVEQFRQQRRLLKLYRDLVVMRP